MKKLIVPFALPVVIFLASCSGNTQKTASSQDLAFSNSVATNSADSVTRPTPVIDSVGYRRLITYLSNGDTTGRWPVKDPVPLAGAVLPFNRVIAYYGNLYSNRMGALGKWPKKEMIPKDSEIQGLRRGGPAASVVSMLG